MSLALRAALAEGGVKGLLAGLAPRLARKSLMQAMVWTLFESLEKKAILILASK